MTVPGGWETRNWRRRSSRRSKTLEARRGSKARQLVPVKAGAVARKVKRGDGVGDGAVLSEAGEPWREKPHEWYLKETSEGVEAE